MDHPEPAPQSRTVSGSAEGIIGIGITIAALGILSLLLGWAEWMRLERHVSMIFLPLGAIMVLGGAVAAMYGQSRKRR